MKKLILKDFKKVQLEGISYYEYREKDIHVCLEPCLNGFDVAIYWNKNDDLIFQKKCTNLKRLNEIEDLVEMIKLGLELANALYKAYRLRYLTKV